MKGMEHAAATMTPDNTPTDPGVAYGLVKGLIFDQVYKFLRQYGGDFEELVGEAHVAFVRCHNQFLTGKSVMGLPIKDPYATEVRRWVWFILFDLRRSQLQAKNSHPTHAIGEGYEIPDKEYDFEFMAWADELSDDARYAVDLLLNPPEAVDKVAWAKGGCPRNYRSTVRDYLRWEGWSAHRIERAFDEIKKALK